MSRINFWTVDTHYILAERNEGKRKWRLSTPFSCRLCVATGLRHSMIHISRRVISRSFSEQCASFQFRRNNRILFTLRQSFSTRNASVPHNPRYFVPSFISSQLISIKVADRSNLRNEIPRYFSRLEVQQPCIRRSVVVLRTKLLKV